MKNYSSEERNQLLFQTASNTPPSNKPSVVDAYNYAPKQPPPSIIVETNPNPNENHENHTMNSIEINKWNETWKFIVDKLTEITCFPPILVQSADEQRKSLQLLVESVCEIAKHPKDSQEYKDLTHELELRDQKITELNQKNSSLKSEIELLKNRNKEEISHFTKKIEILENYALQIEHYTIQVDKRKDFNQASFQRINQSRASTLNNDIKTSPGDHSKGSKGSFEKLNKSHQAEKKNAQKKSVHKSNKKNEKLGHSNTKSDKNSNLATNDNSKKKPNDFKFEENKRFEEDYVAKLIQKYTKVEPTQEVQQANPESKAQSLFERSIKPNDDIQKETQKPRFKRRQWH
ncbi:hypothetical protein TRFO_41512 [Tritrichomonas foetus]|uniref:Uncharacterized protein n=1 Tax=Tritrichomonas foetus TaxID=1144522 RepID=A0A1J4L0D1_9EUKA|nr:hypothetical protein TRFO_41512 [Tritrichomonas foetus]|eukprot:OHT16866.1 hypothetical protein TRFO_41512 [Tritrichomonas foetus]